MYSCTNNLLFHTIFDLIIYSKSQQVIIILLYSKVFYYVYSVKKSINLFLLVDLYNTLKDTKNIVFNLTTTVLTLNKNIGKYT